MECALNELSLHLGKLTKIQELYKHAKDVAKILFPACIAAELVITSKSRPGIDCPMEVLLRRFQSPNNEEIIIQPLSSDHGKHLMEALHKVDCKSTNGPNIGGNQKVILFYLNSCALADSKSVQFIVIVDKLPRSPLQRARVLKEQLSVALDRAYRLEHSVSAGDVRTLPAESSSTTYACCSNGCMGKKIDRTRKCSVVFAESLCEADIGEYPVRLMARLFEELDAETGFLLMEIPGTSEFMCNCVGRRVLEEPIDINLDHDCFQTIFSTKKSLMQVHLSEEQLQPILPILEAALQELKLFVSPQETDSPVLKQWKVDSLIAVPIAYPKYTVIRGIVYLLNKRTGQFSKTDERIIQEYLLHTFPLLRCSLAYHNEHLHKKRSEDMLDVARNIFTHMMDLTGLLLKIMQEARNLTKAQRCSVFLLEPESNMLVAKVLDGLPTAPQKNTKFVKPTGETVILPEEIRIEFNKGIAGHVAQSGEILNIKDAYNHPLFYRGVDQETGFRTKNILCFPIKNEKNGIVGVAQLCNKIGFPYFTHVDEEIARVFSVYCCISIVHSLMYKKVQEAQNRTRLATEMMTYHMHIPEETVEWLSTCEIPSLDNLIRDSTKFSSIPRDISSEDDSYRALMSMFESVGIISRWHLSRSTLACFILMVRRGYRDPPYHNWMHAFTVCHFAFLCVQNLQLLGKFLTDMEVFSLIVSSLCHDIDHRGTNNSFQMQSKSLLAALYSSEGSVLERHHFSQTICILNRECCNIFESLSPQEYGAMLDLVRDMILATDLVHHLNRVPQLTELIKTGYDCSRSDHHDMLCSLLMTSADLSDQTKDWRNATLVASMIYEEFFKQGDLERALGQNPITSMDREKACVPQLQISFLDVIIIPLYDLFVKLVPQAKEIMERIGMHRSRWNMLLKRIERGEVDGNGIEIFKQNLMNAKLYLPIK